MAKLQAMWVHGSNVAMEREGYFVSKKRTGSGAVFRTHGREWFHFAVPTPVIVDGNVSSLKKVFVLFKTEGTAKITAIGLYDGKKKIKSITNISLSGNPTGSVTQHNSWEVSPSPKLKFGLGISVHVDFGPATKPGVPAIHFSTAGADFESP